jgi:hypothetical protein
LCSRALFLFVVVSSDVEGYNPVRRDLGGRVCLRVRMRACRLGARLFPWRWGCRADHPKQRVFGGVDLLFPVRFVDKGSAERAAVVLQMGQEIFLPLSWPGCCRAPDRGHWQRLCGLPVDLRVCLGHVGNDAAQDPPLTPATFLKQVRFPCSSIFMPPGAALWIQVGGARLAGDTTSPKHAPSPSVCI